MSCSVLGILDPSIPSSSIFGVPVLGGDEIMDQYLPDQVELVNGLGSANIVSPRELLF